jgi:predicted P-loop ATPase
MVKIGVTRFADVYAQSLEYEEFCLDELVEFIANTRADDKTSLPMLKCAHFGSVRTAQGALRHDANVETITGTEVDYDGEEMPFEEAIARLEEANLMFVAYTSPSHDPQRPRWRVLTPCSKPLEPGRRGQLVNRLNGVLGGVLARESWGLSQSYYYGRVNGAVFEINLNSDGEYIDEADELDEGALAFRPAGRAGGAGGGQTVPDFDQLDEAGLLDLIHTGRHYFRAAKALLWLWAKQGVAKGAAQQNLEAAFDLVPATLRVAKWSKGRKAIALWVERIYARYAKQKSGYFKALVALFEDGEPHWKGAVRLNCFTMNVEVCDPFTPQPGQVLAGWRDVQEPGDLLRTLIYVQDHGFPTVGKRAVLDALMLVADNHSCHPVRGYLETLRWDGRPRVNRLFLDYFAAELSDPAIAARNQGEASPHDQMIAYLEKTAECFMVGAVARIFEPGCKLDTLPVLIGPQGYLKGQGLQALVPDPKWFTDDISTGLFDRDTKESLVGKWIVELAEFPHIKREVEKVKGFFSRQTDRYRRAYGYSNRDWPRQNTFCATANELEFIDTTGNRRFWPVPMGRPAEVEAIARDRDQLWAEAVELYRTGYRWWLPPSIEAIASVIQANFIEPDLWDEPLADFVDRRTIERNQAGEIVKWEPFGVKDALVHGLRFSSDPSAVERRITDKDEKRAARRLRVLGWEPDPHRNRSANRARYWRPKAPDEGLMLISFKILFQIVFFTWDRVGQMVLMALSQCVPVKNRGLKTFEKKIDDNSC